MSHPYHKVFVKIRDANGAERITYNNVRGKSAQTRWINAVAKNNPGYVVLDSWTLDDGRGLNEKGVRS